jgi:isoleucyl-tRNA synthetase
MFFSTSRLFNNASAKASSDWSKTLRLPKSKFAPRSSSKQQAPYLKASTDELYEWQWNNRPKKNTFVLHDGPPYANGSLHIGHALNKVLKDMILRVELGSGNEGRRVHYRPGWDCHGLPIELKALQRLVGDRQFVAKDPIAVRIAARELAKNTVKEQMKGFKEWGIMADWNRRWTTMDKDYEMKQLEVFKKMVHKG